MASESRERSERMRGETTRGESTEQTREGARGVPGDGAKSETFSGPRGAGQDTTTPGPARPPGNPEGDGDPAAPRVPPARTAPAPAGPDPRRASTFVPLPEPGPPPVLPSPATPDEARALLARLTGRPRRATPLRGLLRRVRIGAPVLALLLAAGAAAQLLRPLPDPGLRITAAEEYRFAGGTPAVPWPETGQGALLVDGVGSFGTSGEQRPVPVASVAKTMTAYVILREHPMRPDSDGAAIEVDQQAQDDFGLSQTRGDSVVDVRAGDTLTQREALQALLIASGNNVAWLLARWDAGTESAFVQKMNDAAVELGMENTLYTDPSGFDAATVSTAEDQVRLAQAVMDEPVFRQIVSVSGYTDSHGQHHPNGNFLVPVGGVVGIKTGSRTLAGGNFLFAARKDVDGSAELILGAVLSQPPHPSDRSIRTGAVLAGGTLMSFAQEELTGALVLTSGTVVGLLDNGTGEQVRLVVTEDVRVVGWSGLRVPVRVTPGSAGPPREAPRGTVVATLTAGDGERAVTVPVATAGELAAPGLADRLLRLG